MKRQGTKVEKITAYVQQNPTANKMQIERAIGFKFSSSQLAVARKRLGISIRSGVLASVSDSGPMSMGDGMLMDEATQRRRLALDMIQQNLSSINRLLMELR